MKYRIYVIEDNENIRNLICVALENFGYCASGFETAEEALDNLSALLRRGREAQREYPAMFVFDWMLPGMDGMAAIRKIREMPDFSAAPVLMLTAKDREMDIVQGLDNGADDYMTKPFGILELSARVRNLLKRVEPAKEEVSSLTIGEVSINRETREVIACGDRTELIDLDMVNTYFRLTERGKLVLASYAIERAPLRRLRSMSAAGRFANTMSTMLTAGLGVPRALDVTSQVVGNYLFSLGVRKVKENVERGRGIAESMAGVECFPKMLTEMVGVGERAGSLPQTLDVIGNYFDSEVETQSTRLLSVLEPVITIVLAVIVVVLLLAVYLPMFSMYGGIA